MAKAKTPVPPKPRARRAGGEGGLGYSGTPLVKKLGIKPGTALALVGAPPGFIDELDGLPKDVRILKKIDGAPDLAIWFVRSRRELEGRMLEVSGAMGQGLWVAWTKKASGVVTDVTEDVVRAAGLANGIVDYKVCAINVTWSGLKFARRRAATAAARPSRTRRPGR